MCVSGECVCVCVCVSVCVCVCEYARKVTSESSNISYASSQPPSNREVFWLHEGVCCSC